MHVLLDAFVMHMVGRISSGPRIRLVLQPTVSIVLAAIDGLADARRKDKPYLAALLGDQARRRERLRLGGAASAGWPSSPSSSTSSTS